MGRKAGSVNRDKSRAITKFRHHSFDPIDEMICDAKEAKERGDSELFYKYCKELAQYAYPKLRSVEHSMDGESTPMFVIQGVALPTNADRVNSEAATGAGEPGQ